MTYRRAFILFAAVYVVFFAPVIFRGEVIYPHNNDIEVAFPVKPDPGHLSSGKFFDVSSVYVPEINLHLKGRHRAWLATWNPDVELGKPSILRGLSGAFLPSNVISFFTDDPFVFYSWSILLTVFLSGLFMFLLVKDLGLGPIASFVAASAISFGVYFTYWLTFFVFLSAFCWTTGLLWVSMRFIKRPSAPLALGAAFFSYSLFMTAYPQSILLQGYVMAGFVLVLLWKEGGEMKKKALRAAMLGLAVASGALLTAPVYMDIFETAARSARLHAGPGFFLRNMPKIHTFGEVLSYLHLLFDAFIFGNPMNKGYAFAFDGLSLSPLYSALFLLTFIKGQWKRLWPWQAFALLCVIGTALPAAHLFAVKYLGFRMSATNYLGGAIIPSAILVGYAVDYLLYSDRGGAPLKKAVVFISLLPVGLLFLLYGGKLASGPSVFYLALDIAIILVFYTIAVVPWRAARTWGVVGLTLVTVFVYGGNLRLIRPRKNIHTTSRVMEFIRGATGGGATRLAFVGFKNIIPPNQESLLGLRSIHAYDSLSSREYQRLVKKLSTFGTYTYGRHFDYITDGSRLGRPEFSYAGIGLYISSMELYAPGLVRLGKWRKYRFYRPAAPPIMAAQVVDYKEKDGEAVLSGRLEDHGPMPVRRLDRYTDYRTFALNPLEGPSLLFVSEQYHPRWLARAGGRALKTVKVNDFYEGVIIPPGTAEVALEFRPWALWMWVPQVIFTALGLGVGVYYLFVSRKRTGGEDAARDRSLDA